MVVFSLPAPDQRRFGYSLGDTVDLHFAGDHEHGVRVTSLRAEHSGAVVTSPGSHPERPLVFTLGPCPADAVPPDPWRWNATGSRPWSGRFRACS